MVLVNTKNGHLAIALMVIYMTNMSSEFKKYSRVLISYSGCLGVIASGLMDPLSL